ncbi:hypothetical protein AK830_g9587 [Neonectria ditissima]|uniref:Uncharacterized protein n=1 Tax=Neonectria ditissima TaxID=78410 RepID=A0A0P7AHP6_9HYPO|nr:hypothetical protein AK830_g9587 [Neonectria ditissima]
MLIILFFQIEQIFDPKNEVMEKMLSENGYFLKDGEMLDIFMTQGNSLLSILTLLLTSFSLGPDTSLVRRFADKLEALAAVDSSFREKYGQHFHRPTIHSPPILPTASTLLPQEEIETMVTLLEDKPNLDVPSTSTTDARHQAHPKKPIKQIPHLQILPIRKSTRKRKVRDLD